MPRDSHQKAAAFTNGRLSPVLPQLNTANRITQLDRGSPHEGLSTPRDLSLNPMRHNSESAKHSREANAPLGVGDAE